MKKILSIFILFLIYTNCFANINLSIPGDMDPALIDKLTHSIVSINVENSVSFLNEYQGQWMGSGAIVDAQRGIIVTNKHLVGISPLSSLQIKLYNGYVIKNAKLIYTHPWHDFSFIQYSPNELKNYSEINLKAIQIEPFQNIHVGMEAFIIGNTNGISNSISKLVVSNLYRNTTISSPSNRWTHELDFTGAIDGGASGSAIFNNNGRVMALTMSKSNYNLHTFGVRMDYIIDDLKIIQRGDMPHHGDLRISLFTQPIGELGDFYQNCEIYENFKFFETKKLRQVDIYKVGPMIQSGLEDEQKSNLQYTDIAYAFSSDETADPFPLGNDLYQFDRMVDQFSHQGFVYLNVLRGPNLTPHTIPTKIYSDEKNFIRVYSIFGNATFHPITVNAALYYQIPTTGVFMSESEPTISPFSDIGEKLEDSVNKKAVVITNIGTYKINTILDFNKALTALNNNNITKTSIVYRDLNDPTTSKFLSKPIEINFELNPLEVFVQDPLTFQWSKLLSN